MDINIAQTATGIIEYSDYGKGQPLLVIHGGHGNCKETLMHKGLDPQEFRIITPSRPGYGATPLEGGGTPTEAAQRIISLMDHLAIKQFSVFGVSAGGPTAIEIAALEPDRVTKLLLASAVTKQWLTKKDNLYRKAKKIFHPKIEKFTWKMFRFFFRLAPKSLSKVMITELSTIHKPKIDEAEREELWSLTKNQQSGQGFLNDLMQKVDGSRAATITSPCLIIHSKNDAAVPIDHAYHAHELIARAELLELDNKWGHLFWIGTDSAEPIQKTNAFLITPQG